MRNVVLATYLLAPYRESHEALPEPVYPYFDAAAEQAPDLDALYEYYVMAAGQGQ